MKFIAKTVCTFAIAVSTFALSDAFGQEATESTLSTNNSAEAGQSIMVAPRPVRLQSEYRPHVGVTMGGINPEGGEVAAAEFGLDVGYQPYIPFGLGAELNVTSGDLQRDSFIVKGSYHFGGDIPVIKDSYVSAGVGAVFKSDGTDAALVPMLGFDIPVLESDMGERISLGANAKYMLVGGSNDDALALRAVAKYWF